MSKPKGAKTDVRSEIRKVAQEVSKWPQWKRGGSAAAPNPPTTTPISGKKQQTG